MSEPALRVVLSSYFYPPSVGGVERQTQHLARGLAARGHRVRVIAARFSDAAVREELDGVEIVRVPAGSGSRWQRMATYAAHLSLELARAKTWAQLVQVQQALYPAAVASIATAALRIPLVVSNRGSGVAGAVSQMSALPLGKLALRMIGARAHCVGVNDEAVEEMRALGWPRLSQINNGVALPELSTEARERARRELGLSGVCALFLGRLEPEKDLELLLRAFTARPREGATLFLVGDGSERAAAERIALARPPRPGVVKFVGMATDPNPWLRAADLFVLPSKSEGISNALLEAMAYGLPVLASDVGGNRQVIDRKNVGRLFPPGDVDALSTLFDQMLGDVQTRTQIGSAAREHMRAHFSIEAMVSAHEQLYRSLVA